MKAGQEFYLKLFELDNKGINIENLSIEELDNQYADCLNWYQEKSFVNLFFLQAWVEGAFLKAHDWISKLGTQGTSDAVKGVGNSIKFGSTTKSAQKLSNQMANRGWTENTVMDTVDNAFTTRSSTNLANNNPATAYFNKDGSYVVVDNVTKEVVQVSNKLDPNWIPDSNIVNPYKP